MTRTGLQIGGHTDLGCSLDNCGFNTGGWQARSRRISVGAHRPPGEGLHGTHGGIDGDERAPHPGIHVGGAHHTHGGGGAEGVPHDTRGSVSNGGGCDAHDFDALLCHASTAIDLSYDEMRDIAIGIGLSRMRWQYEQSTGKYEAFSDECNRDVVIGYMSGLGEVSVQVSDSVRVAVVFDRMVQSSQHGVARRVSFVDDALGWDFGYALCVLVCV